MATTDGRIQVRVGDTITGWLADRSRRMCAATSVDTQARSELELWYSALNVELRRIRLTLAQASCIADACNGWLMDMVIASGLGLVYAECYDAFRLARTGPGGDVSSYGAKWGVDEQALLDYLGTLGPVADHALRDAISRWWELNESATVEGFAKAGLQVTEP
jgi:hypothetical protein